MHNLIISLFWLACTTAGFCSTSTNRNFAEFFAGREGCFVLYDAQVTFVRRLWAESLPVSKDAQRITRELMELSRSDDGRVFCGKTGTAGDPKAGIARLGWFVGCVTQGERRVFFATRITGERDASGREACKITEAILKRLQI